MLDQEDAFNIVSGFIGKYHNVHTAVWVILNKGLTQVKPYC